MHICSSNDLLEFDIANDSPLLDYVQVPEEKEETQSFKELGTLEEEEIREETPKVELKTLSGNLKYAFLGDEQTYTVVISSSLSSDKKDKSLHVLKKCKKRI